MSSQPRLLVSVRNAEEARAAIRGGADIIDVKEPAAGSLGMAPITAITEIIETVTAHAPQIPCSVALGELLELPQSIPSIANTVRWLKMGLSGCRNQPDWLERWMDTRERIRPHGAWIAVAYVDAEAAAAPPIQDVLDAAIQTNCAGLLLDTFSKTSGTLLDAVTSTGLREIASRAQAAGLLIALAGRVRRDDLPTLLAMNPDVIAVRSAVCRGQNRIAVMEEDLVRDFRTAMASQD